VSITRTAGIGLRDYSIMRRWRTPLLSYKQAFFGHVTTLLILIPGTLQRLT